MSRQNAPVNSLQLTQLTRHTRQATSPLFNQRITPLTSRTLSPRISTIVTTTLSPIMMLSSRCLDNTSIAYSSLPSPQRRPCGMIGWKTGRPVKWAGCLALTYPVSEAGIVHNHPTGGHYRFADQNGCITHSCADTRVGALIHVATVGHR